MEKILPPGSRLRIYVRTGVLLLFMFSFSVSASALAQRQTITLNLDQVSIHDFLKAVKSETGVNFLYDSGLLDNAGRVTIHAENELLDKVLKDVLGTKGLTYSYRDDTVVLKRDERQSPPAPRTITGRIIDQATGNPLAGATVLYKETLQGTRTDGEGNFRLTVAAACTELAVSYLGYESQTVDVAGKTHVTVALRESANEVEQVVVTGYFNKSKESFTGAVTSVQREELRKFGNANMIEALRMIDPSFKIKENNAGGSDPNTLPDFFVRGESSFMGSSNVPTFIVDGYEVSLQKIFDMDLDRIESLTILKDASATILYGSRAANGVIVIETRRPAGGDLAVSYTNRTTLSMPDLTDYNLMNAREKLEFEIKAGLFDPANIADLQHLEEIRHNVARGVNTDWIAQPTRTSVSHAHSVNIEGGSDRVVYGVSVNYNRNNGVVKQSHREVYGATFDLTYRISGKVSIRNSFNYTQTNVQNSPYGSFSLYAAANPYNPIHDENGELIPSYTPHTGRMASQYAQYQNPLYNASLPYRDEQGITSATNNLSVDYFFTPEFRFKGSVAVTKGQNSSDKFISPDNSIYQTTTATEKGSYTKRDGDNFSYNVNAMLSYSLTRDKHILFAGAGLNAIENQMSYSEYSVVGFLDGNFKEIWLGAKFMPGTKPIGYKGKDRMIGLFVNANYAYDSRYFADVSARFDGSSKFGSDRRFAPFYSVGAGWNINNEAFLKDATWLSRLKLRGSIGTTGNQSFSPYLARTTLEFDTDLIYFESVGASFMAFGNKQLEWQKTLKRNVGLDLEILDRRLTMRFDLYNDKTNSLLLPISVTPSLGFTSYIENVGEQLNRGFEFDITGVIMRRKDFDWAVNISGTRNVNRITKISDALKKLNDLANSDEGSQTRPIAMYEAGQSVNAIKVVRSLGINPASGKELFISRYGQITETWDYLDKIVAGCTDADLEGNVGTNVMWKDFTFNVQFRYSFGGQIYNSTLAERIEGADPRANADRRILDQRWQQPNDVSFYKDIADRTVSKATSRFVQNNDYLELSTISLAYNLPATTLKRLGISRARIGLNSNNLFHFSTVRRERGLDYPFARQYTFSLNLTF